MPTPLDLLIERWFAIGWLVFGLSHLLQPDTWAALFLPLRERGTGGLVISVFILPLGVAVVLAHNIWVLGIPVLVTLTGWAMILKGLVYLFFPRAPLAVMPDARLMHNGFRIAGAAAMLLGAVLAYDSFFRRQ
jgi:uncharacterized protein YjeT (DUF2065 family)